MTFIGECATLVYAVLVIGEQGDVDTAHNAGRESMAPRKTELQCQVCGDTDQEAGGLEYGDNGIFCKECAP